MTNRGHVLYCGAILDFNFKTSVRKFCRKRFGLLFRLVDLFEVIFKFRERHFRVVGFREGGQILSDGIFSAEMFPDIRDTEIERDVKVLVQVLVVARFSFHLQHFLNSVLLYIPGYLPREMSVMYMLVGLLTLRINRLTFFLTV